MNTKDNDGYYTDYKEPAPETERKKWLVRTGNMEGVVEAESVSEATAALFAMYDDQLTGEGEEEPTTGMLISAIQVIGEEYYMTTEHALKKAGRWAGVTG